MKILLRSTILFASAGRIRSFASSPSQPLYPSQSRRESAHLLYSSPSSSSSSSSSEMMPPPQDSMVEDLGRAKLIIARAISIGAPAYNAGDVQRCASVYAEAARQIAELVPPSLRERLTMEVENNNGDYHNAQAWALRRVFDSIVEYEAPINSSSSSSYSPSNIISKHDSSVENLGRAKQIIARAISIGAPAYNAGDVQRCASVYAEAAREIAELVPSSMRERLAMNVERSDENDHNAQAWALRRVFDSIVEYEMPFVPKPATDYEGIALEPFTKSQIGDGPVGVMDGVMGGISSGSWVPDANAFLGRISLENNGGFASLRWRFFDGPHDWSSASGVYFTGLRHSRPGEHTFRLTLKDRACERARLANFKATFANPQIRLDDDDGSSLSSSLLLVPFSAFGRMEQMGRVVDGSPAFDPRAVTEIGLMAIKPTVVGDFRLEFLEWGLYK
ncbi:hypothetical protein ACHAXA_005605 [Cyclostephanos tholiformis]|uniref:NADH:ubiquinone oxidoreductase intermediate-associated protein 30 domain-containing protein n=1 Tax=Cyclostephanos tholiformis TaxID=382380 RepID=A0ABD3SGD3_9STRA